MLTKEGPGRYTHADGDTYSIEIAVEGTLRRINAVLGDQPIQLPRTIDRARYAPFMPNYDVNALFTFSQDSTPSARYTVTFRDSNGTVVDTRPVRLPTGSTVPRTLHRLYEFRIV